MPLAAKRCSGGGLKATAPTGKLVVQKENTLNSGEISRDTVADVCVRAVFDNQSQNKVPRATAERTGSLLFLFLLYVGNSQWVFGLVEVVKVC